MELHEVDLTTEAVRTDRLLLRPHRPDDEAVLYAACQDPDIQRWIGALPVPYTAADAREFVTATAPGDRAARRGMPVAVEVGGVLVGSSGLIFREGRLGPEIGYWIAPWARGRGYAVESTRAVAGWAFAHGAHRVHLFVDVRNAASLAVARRAGFTREGVARAALEYRDGTRGDAALFSQLAGD